MERFSRRKFLAALTAALPLLSCSPQPEKTKEESLKPVEVLLHKDGQTFARSKHTVVINISSIPILVNPQLLEVFLTHKEFGLKLESNLPLVFCVSDGDVITSETNQKVSEEIHKHHPGPMVGSYAYPITRSFLKLLKEMPPQTTRSLEYSMSLSKILVDEWVDFAKLHATRLAKAPFLSEAFSRELKEMIQGMRPFKIPLLDDEFLMSTYNRYFKKD